MQLHPNKLHILSKSFTPLGLVFPYLYNEGLEMSSEGLSYMDERALSASVLKSLPAPSLRPQQEVGMICTS